MKKRTPSSRPVAQTTSEIRPRFAPSGWRDILVDWAVRHKGEGTGEAEFRRLSLSSEGQRIATFLRQR